MILKDRYAIYAEKVDPKEKISFCGWYLNIKHKGKTDEQMFDHKKPVSSKNIWYKKYCVKVPEWNRMTLQWWMIIMSRDNLSEEDMYTYVMQKNSLKIKQKIKYNNKCKKLWLIPFNAWWFMLYHWQGKSLDWIIQHTKEKPYIYRGEIKKVKKYEEISMWEKIRLKRIELWHILT